MAEIRIDAEQLERLNTLFTQLAGDPALRGTLEADAAAVLAEFGLDSLVASGVSVSVDSDDTAAYQLPPPPPPPLQHHDHADHVDWVGSPIKLSLFT
jgi:hypothetical protein